MLWEIIQDSHHIVLFDPVVIVLWVSRCSTFLERWLPLDQGERPLKTLAKDFIIDPNAKGYTKRHDLSYEASFSRRGLAVWLILTPGYVSISSALQRPASAVCGSTRGSSIWSDPRIDRALRHLELTNPLRMLATFTGTLNLRRQKRGLLNTID